MKRILVALSALVLLGSAVACTDNDSNAGSSGAADSAGTQTQSSSFEAPSRNQSAGANLGDNADTSEVVKAIRPSVVRIRAGGTQQGAFGTISRGEGTGTGFIVDAKGFIVTNNHVVTLGTTQEANRIQVDLWDGRTVEGQVVGRDERSDLAVIKIDANNLTPIRFADSTRVEVGDEVLAIGFALDLGSTPTVTKGVVSAKDRVIEETLNAGGRPVLVSISGAIQTDAAINPGNSGGPLVNMQGEVIGVNTAGLLGTGSQPVQGIFFAVSAQVAEPIVRTLIDTGRVERGFLGIEPLSITREIAQAQNLSVNEGAGLRAVTPGSAAERAGLRAGDVITKIGDHAIKNAGDLSNALATYRPGQTVKVEFVRSGRAQSVDVTLGERPAGQ
jgi:S1-C subfamily serine protease